MSDEVVELEYTRPPPQDLVHSTAVRQLFYGGAAGGGKSHSIRLEAIGLCLQNPGLNAYLFRRTLPELEDNHLKQLRALPKAIGHYHETKKEFQFINGSFLICGYAEREGDIWNFRGKEMHWVGVDEASLMTPIQLSVLRAWNRLGGWKPAPGYEHVLPRIVFASNPGGPSHSFLKQTFIDPCPAETAFWDKTMADPDDPEDKGWSTMFIPAKIRDNPHLDKNYAGNLGGLPPEMAKAYREGDWDVVVGAALTSLSRSKHMIRRFDVPRHWTHFMSMDWGTAAPFSINWYAVAGETALVKGQKGWPDVFIPAGAVIMIREWYGWTGEANKGCRLSAPEVARGIKQREEEWDFPPMDYRVADSQMWAQTDGPSPAERFSEEGVFLRQAKKDRKAGYSEILARLAGNPIFMENGEEGDSPMFFIMEGCTQFWRTVPILTLDETDPDKGPDTKLEDHCYDSVIYALRSRPYVTTPHDRWEQELVKYGLKKPGQTRDPYD